MNANSQVNTNETLNIQNGFLQTDESFSGFGVAIDIGSGGTGTLNLSNNGILRTIDGSALRIGDSFTGNGTVNLLDNTAQIETDGDLLVSVVGEAELNVLNGAVVNTGGNAEIARGFFGGSPQGTATVSGIGSQWSINGFLFMGSETNSNVNATLNVENGGSVNAGSIFNYGSSTISGNGLITTTTLTNNATISPGLSIGDLTIDGNYEQQGGSLIDFEIGGTTADLYDQLVVTGNVSFLNDPSTFQLSFVNGFNPTVGDEFLELITFGGNSSGNLDNLLITSNNNNFLYETVLGANTIGIRVTDTASTPEPSLLLGFFGLGTWLITSRKRK